MKGSIKEVLKFLHTLVKKDGDQSGEFLLWQFMFAIWI